MTGGLFTVDPTPATPLAKARARLAKAEADYAQAEELLECQGQEAWPRYRDARNKHQRARRTLAVEENRELERLKQQTK